MDTDSKNLKEPLLPKEEAKEAVVSKCPYNAAPVEKKKDEEEKKDHAWSSESKETHGVLTTLKFTLPALWQGGF